MSVIEVLLIAIGLSMDAFAVSVCKGLATEKVSTRHFLLAGIWFGGFQSLMPTIGFILGATFEGYITAIDHWIAFVLLVIIGAGMIKETFEKDDEKADASFTPMAMLILAVATSIDALAVGVTFAFMIKSIAELIFAVTSIGIITFILSGFGIKIGSVFGTRYKKKAELTGGIILIVMGTKFLLEGLGIIA